LPYDATIGLFANFNNLLTKSAHRATTYFNEKEYVTIYNNTKIENLTGMINVQQVGSAVPVKNKMEKLKPNIIKPDITKLTTKNITKRIGFKLLFINDEKDISNIWWYKYYINTPACLYYRLFQSSGTCWMNSILNLLLLTPDITVLLVKKYHNLGNDQKKYISTKKYDDLLKENDLATCIFIILNLLIIKKEKPITDKDLVNNIGALVKRIDKKDQTITNGNSGDSNSGLGIVLTGLDTLQDITIVDYDDVLKSTEKKISDIQEKITKLKNKIIEINNIIIRTKDDIYNNTQSSINNKRTSLVNEQNTVVTEINNLIKQYNAKNSDELIERIEILKKQNNDIIEKINNLETQKDSIIYGSYDFDLSNFGDNVKIKNQITTNKTIIDNSQNQINENETIIKNLESQIITNNLKNQVNNFETLFYENPLSLLDSTAPTNDILIFCKKQYFVDNNFFKNDNYILTSSIISFKPKNKGTGHAIVGIKCGSDDNYYLYDSNNIIVQTDWQNFNKNNPDDTTFDGYFQQTKMKKSDYDYGSTVLVYTKIK
jgi:hypothetical protein